MVGARLSSVDRKKNQSNKNEKYPRQFLGHNRPTEPKTPDHNRNKNFITNRAVRINMSRRRLPAAARRRR